VEEIHLHRELFEDRYLEVKYEDITDDPRRTVGELVRFCGLSELPGLNELFPKSLGSMNYKWERSLNESQKLILTRVAGDRLSQLGYSP
jgi:hypothetical protein